MKQKQNFLCLVVLFLLLMGAFIFYFRGAIGGYFVKHRTELVLNSVSSHEEIQKNQRQSASFDYEEVTALSFEDLLKQQMAKQNYPVIGVLALPDVGICLPIFKGVDPSLLMAGAGTLKNKQMMGQGNYALASHHIFDALGYSGAHLLFSPLLKTQEGQKVYLTDLKQVFCYEITSMSVVPETQGTVILDTPGKKEVTLVTCYDQAAHFRYVVKGNLVSVQAYDQKTAFLFHQSFNQN